MSSAAGDIEFRNREQELDHLLGRLPPQARHSTITFLRAPSGYGKTRLVDQVLARLEPGHARCVVVEPDIRARHQSARVYAWYFVQRAAAASPTPPRDDVSFSGFLKRRRLRKIHWRSIYESGKEAASLSKLTKIAIEIGENLLGRNRFHPDALLKDESSFATELARDYMEWLVKQGPVLFVVRETQLIDLESFRYLLKLHKVASSVFILFEYTGNSEFLPEHQKIIEECRSTNTDIRIVDLLKLNQKEFLFLLKKYVDEGIEGDSAEFARWNGNLRLVRELKEQVYVDRPVDQGSQPAPLASDLRVLIHDRVQRLSNLAKLTLASVVCHVEALPAVVLGAAVKRADPSAHQAALDHVLVELISGSRYLRSEAGRLAVSDEDVASVIAESPSFARFRALAERSLRDVYLASLSGDRGVPIPVPLAFRQSIALCLATGDAAAVRRLMRTLAEGARSAHDQTMYVSLVADALFQHRNGGRVANSELYDWAAASAYEIGDYRLASELLEALVSKDPLYEAMLGFCYGETNRHALALEIGQSLEASNAASTTPHLLGRLVQVANLFAVGRKAEAVRIHRDMRSNASISNDPMFGYVLRFTELLENFPDCTDDVLASIDHFDRHEMTASAAYSSLSGAMHLAYAGDLSRAAALIASARDYLRREVRDLHILLNNEVVVALLSPGPNFERCLETLDEAAYSVRDDFYRAVIENNRLICRWQAKQHDDALLSVALLEETMRAPGFGNRDVFWTFTYNCWAFLREIGQSSRADALLQQLRAIKMEHIDFDDYWLFRFGQRGRPPARYDHLLQFRYHAEYLSHWLVDPDAMRVVKAKLLA